uniref:Transforming growth factor beta regulator 1 n=1 Tax=Cacopsylla melanoneura TaxID=428564 RepID=A0A8D8VB99_9HEMI
MVTKMKPKKTSKYWKKKWKQIKKQIKEMVYMKSRQLVFSHSKSSVNSPPPQVVRLHPALKNRHQRKDSKPSSSTSTSNSNNSNTTSSSNNSTISKPRKPSGTSPSPVVKRKKLTHQIKLDSSGQPVFPIELGTFTVHSLGEISGTSGFNTTDIIFPIGYCSTRIYASTRNPKQECLYICLIKEMGGFPRFEISADNEPHMPIIGTTPDECHLNLLQRLSITRVQPKGIDFFGLSHPTVHYLIQSSPNAKRCSNYVFTRFEVSKTPKEETLDSKSSESNDFKLNHKAFLKHLQLIEANKNKLANP